ncbi:MAG: hypothetical protein MZU84_07765 [Sphingobacterium sp.]|nr:hypothetical protein [Sphingobacterium sp.]
MFKIYSGSVQFRKQLLHESLVGQDPLPLVKETWSCPALRMINVLQLLLICLYLHPTGPAALADLTCIIHYF